MTPVVLTVAGSDSSAGAGMQADVKTACALGCYPLTAVTCVVCEAPGCVEGIVPMQADFVAAQVRLCLRRFPVAAAKCGMLYSPGIVRAVAEALRGTNIPLVVDPVMLATAGEPLMLREALSAYREQLFPLAFVVTPNLDELCCLLGCPAPSTPDELAEAATGLSAQLGCAVLAKGGHLPGHDCTDILVDRHGAELLRRTHPRTEGISTHGTGCTLSAALASGLACGLSLTAATERALRYTAAAIAHSHRFPAVCALNHTPPVQD